MECRVCRVPHPIAIRDSGVGEDTTTEMTTVQLLGSQYGEVVSINISAIAKTAPKLLVPVAAYVGSAALGVTGIVFGHQAAGTRSRAESRAALGEPARANLEEALVDFEALRISSYDVTVGRLTSWLDQHLQVVEHIDVDLADGEGIRVWTSPKASRGIRSASSSAPWLLAASNAGPHLQKAVFWAVQNSGVSSTGTSIGVLSGAALESAVLAALGNGTLANGGAGIAGGQIVMGAVNHVPVAVAGGLVAAAAGLSVKAEAIAFAKAVDGQIAQVEKSGKQLTALEALLRNRTAEAVDALDRLEAQPNGQDELAEAFATVALVGEVLSTFVFDEATGDITPACAEILAKSAERG